MRCLSCNVALTNYEATRKFKESEEFVDLCNNCFNSSDFDDDNFITRSDLETIINEEEYYEED